MCVCIYIRELKKKVKKYSGSFQMHNLNHSLKTESKPKEITTIDLV
jgi:hypothetical protein